MEVKWVDAQPAIDWINNFMNNLRNIVSDALSQTAYDLKGMVVNTIATQQGDATVAPPGTEATADMHQSASTFLLASTPAWEPLSDEWVEWGKNGSPTPILIHTGEHILSIGMKDASVESNVCMKVGVFGDIGKAAALEMGFGGYGNKEKTEYVGSSFGNVVRGPSGNSIGIPPRSYLVSTINRKTAILYKSLITRLRRDLEKL